jgi:predicted nucleic acid-binding protein
MNPRRALVLDANILMRAVLGRRVRELLEGYEDSATFYSPDVCLDDARHYLSQVLEERGLNVESGLAILEQISQLVVLVDRGLYGDYEQLARERIEIRDPDDWPQLGCHVPDAEGNIPLIQHLAARLELHVLAEVYASASRKAIRSRMQLRNPQ